MLLKFSGFQCPLCHSLFLPCAVVLWPSTAVWSSRRGAAPRAAGRGRPSPQPERGTAGGRRRRQQHMMATELPRPQGAFHATEAQKPHLRLLHMLRLQLLCLSTAFFTLLLFLVLSLVHSTAYLVSSRIMYLLRVFQRSWLKAAGINAAENT